MKTLKTLFFASIILLTTNSFAQKYITKNGHIRFYSETPMETIDALNKQVNCALDSQTGDFVFKVLMKSFEFEKALMQEHFNENYAESDKYPNAMFKGKVTNIADIDFSVDGKYPATIEGDLTIHGVTNKVKHSGTFTVIGGKIDGLAVFNVKPSDYKIRIPNAVSKKIADSLEITVDVRLDKMD
ncbi:MAG: YceI family protein [Chlorobi bacterium]|nr:YceI family protein [Chlorobiota bacterium]